MKQKHKRAVLVLCEAAITFLLNAFMQELRGENAGFTKNKQSHDHFHMDVTHLITLAIQIEEGAKCMRKGMMYRGPVKLAVLDLAGTVLDFGSRAPAEAFVELFARLGVSVTDAEARGPMGMHKREHIAAICALPSPREQWIARHGSEPTASDIQSLYQEFIPLQLEVLSQHGALVPGADVAIAQLRGAGLKVAFTTGYNREMLHIVMAECERQRVHGDAAVCGSDVPQGRPAPWMALECARQTGVYPPAACVKCGDTIVDIQEGRNAGMWSIGVAISGNMTGLSLEEWQALAPKQQEQYRMAAHEAMFAAGAHAVIDSVAALPGLIESINKLMQEGGTPDIAG
jgi:phosphonoacetaldehyde hydrolase